MSAPSPEVFLEQWLSDLASDDRAPGTIRRYKSAITSFLAWYAEVERRPLALEQLSAIVLVGYRTFLQQTQGRSTSTVNGHVSALRAWCAWLVERRHLGASPARGVKLVGRQAASDRKGLEPNQVHALLRQVATSRDALRNTTIVQLLLQTGMRLDECSHLHLEDIAFGERSGRVTIRAGKGNKARVVPLNASARQALADYLAPRFGEASFTITRLLSTSAADTTRWAARTTWEELVATLMRQSMTLSFASPTAFNISGKYFALFPEPPLVWESLVRSWNSYAPDSLKIEKQALQDLLRHKVTVTGCSLWTHTLHYPKYTQKGFAGTCTYTIQEDGECAS